MLAAPALEVPAVTAICWVPVLRKYQVPLSLLTLMPFARVRSLRMLKSPLTFRLLPRVTPSKVAETPVSGVVSVLSTVPFLIVPVKVVRPPLPNAALPMSSVFRVLSRTPVRFTVLPAVRLKANNCAVVKLPVRFKTPAA